MAGRPLVSCILPVYNGEEYLHEALDSVFAQTYGPVECIAVDDGSTDATAAIVSQYPADIVYAYQENSGPSSARNLGLKLATGDYISFIDADDLWHAEKTQRQIGILEARPELDFCGSYVENFWIPELREEAERFRNHPRSKPIVGYTTASLFARKRLFDAVGGFDESLQHCDATEWFLRAREAGGTGEIVAETLVFRRIHFRNRSRLLARNSQIEFSRLLKSRLDRLRATATIGD